MSRLANAGLVGIAGAAVTAALLLVLTPYTDFSWASIGTTIVVMAAVVFGVRRGRSNDELINELSEWKVQQ